MKILLVNHFPLTGSGSGVYNANIAHSLMRKGHDVRIVMPENIKVSDSHLHPVYFKGEENIEGSLPFNFPCFTTHPRSVKSFHDLTAEELYLYKKAFTDALAEEVENFEPDVIHASHIWILADIASSFDVPLVITAHGTDLFGYNESPRFREEAERAVTNAFKIISPPLPK